MFSTINGDLGIKIIEEYGIKNAEFITDHMIALLFYTDFTNLSTDFSATFRKEKDESLKDWKSRNSAYHHWSKRIREAVEIFGQTAEKGKIFYHGISQRLFFPNTIARLCSPTSMTQKIGIAEGFAGDEGLVVTLSKYDDINYLDLSNISAYPDEKEQLLVGGYRPLRIIQIFEKRTPGIVHKEASAIPMITILSELISGKNKNATGKIKKYGWLYGLIESSIKNINNDDNVEEMATKHLIDDEGQTILCYLILSCIKEVTNKLDEEVKNVKLQRGRI
eukprot:183379_1